MQKSYIADGSLVLHIKNKQPIEVLDLANLLSAFDSQYKLFLEQEGVCHKNCPKLFVKEVEKGSIIAVLTAGFLFSAIQMPIPFPNFAETILNYSQYLETILNIIKKDEQTITNNQITKKDCENILKITEPIAKDNASQLIIQTQHFNPTINININIDSNEANMIQNKANKLLETLNQEESTIRKNVVLYFKQARNETSNKGDLGIIEKIDLKAKKILFENDEIKTKMLNKGIFNNMFYVDIEIIMMEEKIKAYKVINLIDFIKI
jgi:hypothetical protein